MDWKPEPQSRLTVKAGISFGTPTRKPTCRAKYAASEELWNGGKRKRMSSINLSSKKDKIYTNVGNLSKMINYMALR